MQYFRYNDPTLSVSHTMDEHPVQSHFYMHTHVHAELYCFLSGKGVFHVEGTAYPLNSGDILLMRPGEAHYMQLEADGPYERICINFDPGLFDALDREGVLVQPLFDRKAGKRNLYRLEDDTCLQLLRRMVMPGGGNRMQLLGNLLLLLQALSTAFLGGKHGSLQPDTLEYRIIRYINKNLDKNLTLQDLCDRFFVSRTQLCQCFKQATGASVGSYITVKRLLTARKMLRQGIKPTEVFGICGYHDYSTFFRAYTKLFGHSPRQEQSGEYALPPDARILIGQNVGIFSEEL